MSILISMVGFPGKSACALVVVLRLPVNESPQLHKPAVCSLGEPASKAALGSAPLLSNRLRHFLNVTICSTWGQLSKVGAGVRWPVRRQAPERAIGSVLALPAMLARRLFRMKGVGPFKSMGKERNFNPTMCCPGQQSTDLSWQCKLLSSHQSRSGSRFFSCNRLWMPSSLLINGFSGSTAADG
jgi:hypothetical protein